MPRMLLNSEGFNSFGGDTTFSHHPQSQLTFRDSAVWKKRAYMALSQQNNLRLQSGLYASVGATTSERPAVVPPSAMVLPSFSSDLVSSLYSTNVEITSLVSHQMQRLQSGLEILKRKQSTDLQSVVQQQAMKRLRVKEEELERVKQRNRDLEEQVLQLSAESQVWFNYAKSAESDVSYLRAKLKDVSTNHNKYPALDIEEGFGDSGRDVESVCEANEETELHRKAICRVCREMEVCVLLLPCRHLCLCKGCEGKTETCPVCNSTRNASIQVLVQRFSSQIHKRRCGKMANSVGCK